MSIARSTNTLRERALQIEHITPLQHQGTDDVANLALACHHCNRHKSPNLSGIDPDTGQLTRLFDPRMDNLRMDQWSEHFTAKPDRILDFTDIG